MKPTPTNQSERRYASDLKKIAKATSAIIHAHTDKWKYDVAANALLAAYSKSLTPWAMRTAGRMVAEVLMNNNRYWSAQSKALGKSLKIEQTAHIGMRANEITNAQVELIKSIPIQAGERAQRLSMEALTGGKRADEVAAEIARTEEVTANRAMLIARTEVSKANAAITQARAESVGVTSYIWHTSEDGDVRDSHADMDGEIIDYANPPMLSDGMQGHAGEFPNCRCWQEPIIQTANEEI